MRGQASVEYLAIIGVVIVAIALVSSIAWQQNETSARVQQANIAANIIASTADNLYAQGPGSKASVKVIIPSGYSSSKSSITSNTIKISVNTPGGYMDVIAFTKANVSGTLPSDWGIKTIDLQTIEGYVNISSS